MGSPFDNKVVPLRRITERQLDFLCDLQKRILVALDYTDEDVVVFMDAFELKARDMGRQDASAAIDDAIVELRQAQERRAVVETSQDEDIEGFWELPDGRIVKVQIAVHGSGRPYGKLLNVTTGSFEYDPGILTEVRKDGTRLTLERAKELGHLYGMCIRCGATLTDEGSIEAGIGPICATKF